MSEHLCVCVYVCVCGCVFCVCEHTHIARKEAVVLTNELSFCSMLSGRFGRFGVGLKAAFVFGKNVLLRLESKQANAGGRVMAELDYKQMQETNVYRGNISLPKSSAADLPGTKITISRIDPVFWKEHGEVNQVGTWSLKPEARKRLAEKYCLYMHGVLVLQRALVAGGHKSGLKMALPNSGQRRQLAIIVEGKDLRTEATNDVLSRMFTLCGNRQRADDASGSASQAPTQDMMVFPHPLWHTSLTCTGESGVGQTPGRRAADKNRTVAELVLFFRPKVGEEPAEEDTQFWSSGPSVMVFWQGLYFAEERLDAQVLPWMKKAKESYNKRTEAEMVDACDRVVGFLFLDGSFRPDSHKTRLHMQDEQVKELMEVPLDKHQRGRQERMLQPNNTALMNAFREVVRKWHDEHDRLNTFKNLLRNECGDRDGQQFYRWERLLKVFPPGTAGKASRGPELEYRAMNAAQGVMGDPVKINVKGTAGMGRLQIVRGYVKFIETSTEAKPHSDGKIYLHRLHRPLNAIDGCGPYRVEQIMYESRKDSEMYLKKEDQLARSSYPNNLHLSRRVGGHDMVLGSEVVKLARDELESLTLVVDIIDGNGGRIPFELEHTKIKLSNIYVQVAVLRDHTNPQHRVPCPFDENSPHVLIRYNMSSRAEGGRYVLEAQQFEGWSVFDRAGKYVLVVSLYYDMSAWAVQECGACCDRVRKEVKVEILSGTPKMVTLDMPDTNLWFGIHTGPLKMVFSESSGAPMAPHVLAIDQVCWHIPDRTEPRQLRVTVTQGNWMLEGFVIEDGWFLGGSEQQEVVRFVVHFSMQGQSRKLDLTADNRVVMKGGTPAAIQVVNEAALQRLEPNNQVACGINVLDRWGNNVRGSNRRPLKLTTKSKCLDRNRPHEQQFPCSPIQMDLGCVTASFGDNGKLQMTAALPGVVALEATVDLQVLRMQLCFVHMPKGQTKPAEDAIGPNLDYCSADMPAKILLQVIDPKSGNLEHVDRQLTLKLTRSTSTESVSIKLAQGSTSNLVSFICPNIQNASGSYVATSEDGMMQASINIKILPGPPANLLIRSASHLTARMGQPFNLGFDVVDSKGVVYSDSTNLKMLLQSSDGSIEFDPPPDEEDGTFEVHHSSPDSQMGLFYLRTALVGHLPSSRKANLTVILQGRQQIKRSVVAQLEAGMMMRGGG